MDSKRNFLEAAMTVGMECDLIRPDDVLRHLPPDILAENLPVDSKTRLLSASLQAGRMDADLVFEALDVRVLAEHMPMHYLWACISEAARRALNEDSGATATAAVSAGPGKAATPASSSVDSGFRRRPNLSRRPARLIQNRPKRTTGELDLDAELAGRWATPSTRDADPAATGDQPLNEWADEPLPTDTLNPRKR